MERGQWARWAAFYEGPVTQSIVALQTSAGIAADTQTFLHNHNIILPTGPVFTEQDAQRTAGALKIYNTVGRIMIGVNSAKYGIRLSGGDIDILAPPDMPPEEWQGDRLGAIPLIIYALAVGGVLVAGLWAGSEMMKASADKDATKYKKAILQADKEIMKAAPDVRADWMRRRKDFESQINKTKDETGILVDIFGQRGGALIAIAAVALIALIATRFVKK